MKWRMENGEWRIKKENNSQLQKGLTLIEILIAVGIATVTGVLLLVVIVNSAGLFSKQSAKVQQGLNINEAISLFRSSIKQASAIAGQYTDGSITYTTGASQIVLKIASIDVSGNIIANSDDFFIFFLDQGFLYFKTFPDPLSSRKAVNQILSNNIESLNFTYLNSVSPPEEVVPASATKIRVKLTLKEKTGADFETNIATSEADLRND